MSEVEKFTFELNRQKYPVYLPSNISIEEAEKIQVDLEEQIAQKYEIYPQVSREILISICLIETLLFNRVSEKEQAQYKSNLNRDLHDLLETLNQQNI